MTHNNRKKLINFIFWSDGCSLLKAKNFSFRLDVLYGGLGINKLQFLIRNRKKKMLALFFSQIFVIKTLILIRSGSVSVSRFSWDAGSGSVSGFYESGSTTLRQTKQKICRRFIWPLLFFIDLFWDTRPNFRPVGNTCLCRASVSRKRSKKRISCRTFFCSFATPPTFFKLRKYKLNIRFTQCC